MKARIYPYTIATPPWYSEDTKNATNLELHIRASLSGDIHRNRIKLTKSAVPFFQRMVRRQYGRRISANKIKVRFEKEEPSKTPRNEAQVEPIQFTYRGKRQHAQRLPSMILRLTKRPRRKARERAQRKRTLRWKSRTRNKLVKRKPTKLRRVKPSKK